MNDTDKRPVRIAILGGGPAGLSTAYHLTNRPNWQDDYEITIYQMGWRLGGKAASSRNADAGQRIEEHGIHLFGNFYFNMFQMLDDCYRTLYGDPSSPIETDEPVTTLASAFKGSNFQGLPDFIDGRWVFQTGWLAHNDGEPWSGELPDITTVLDGIAYQALAVITGRRPGFEPHEHERSTVGRIVRRAEDMLFTRLSKSLLRLVEDGVEDHSELLEVLVDLRTWLQRLMRRIAQHNLTWRWKFVQIDLLTTLLQGVIADEVLEHDIDVLDQWDYREWLQRHGISDMALASGFAQIVPNIGFNYPGGDSTEYPAFSAAPYVYFFIRQLIASGDALYYFAAGTGDTIIAPVYRTLVERGVKFEFFHKVTDIVPGATTIDEIHFDVQARPLDTDQGYDPLIRVKGMYCWPHVPKYELLADGERLRDAEVDLESYWTPWKGKERVLRLGEDGEDGFDVAVLAISIAAFPTVCPKILAQREDWRVMHEKIQAFPTQQLQLWFDRTTEELGWRFGLEGTTNRVVGANYTYPYNTFCDFTDLLQWEDWPDADPPRGLVYWSGPLQQPTEWPPYDDHDFPAREHIRARATAIQYLRTIRGLIPDASANPDQPQSLDFDYLHAHDPDTVGTGENQIDQQYWRPNIDPTERYVGSIKQTVGFRKKAWESGYDNLALAGDWTYNGMNIGSIESAATSGAFASLAVSGSPTLDEIPGAQFLHPDLHGPDRPIIPGLTDDERS